MTATARARRRFPVAECPAGATTLTPPTSMRRTSCSRGETSSGSYFAAALLAPKTPFRQFLAKHAYAINSGDKIELTKTLVMRRMPSVSPYPVLALLRRLSAG